MNMQQMMIQAQKMQRELRKAISALHEQEFTLTKAGLVTVVLTGDKRLKSVTIEEDAFEKDNKEMIEDMITAAVNELAEKIDAEEAAINERIAGQKGGLGLF